jgi:hypothetical protein
VKIALRDCEAINWALGENSWFQRAKRELADKLVANAAGVWTGARGEGRRDVYCGMQAPKSAVTPDQVFNSQAWLCDQAISPDRMTP